MKKFLGIVHHEIQSCIKQLTDNKLGFGYGLFASGQLERLLLCDNVLYVLPRYFGS